MVCTDWECLFKLTCCTLKSPGEESVPADVHVVHDQQHKSAPRSDRLILHVMTGKTLQLHNSFMSQNLGRARKTYRRAQRMCLHRLRVENLDAQTLPECLGAFGHALAAQAAWPWQLVSSTPVNEASLLMILASADWVKQAVQQL